MASKAGMQYILHYWPGIPGRGEFVRLAFESCSHPYAEQRKPMDVVGKVRDSVGHPPHFAPPVLEVVVSSDNKSSSPSSSFISQTPAILAYLAPILYLDGDAALLKDEVSAAIQRAQVNQITLTILDLNNETHDVHHPVAAGAYYEEQKEESKRRASDFRKNRVPKFFHLFQSTLESNPASQDWLIGSRHTIADLALFQVLDGLHFAFPRLMAALHKSGKYDLLFGLREKVAAIDAVQRYLQSDRRQQYSNGIFRHYPELDGEE